MKAIDRLADLNKGHYVAPKAPTKEEDKRMRDLIALLKKQKKENHAK